jgi:hypothetical protein
VQYNFFFSVQLCCFWDYHTEYLCVSYQLESPWLYLGHRFALEYLLALIKRTAGMHDASKCFNMPGRLAERQVETCLKMTS